MPKKPETGDDEQDLFRTAMRGVKPLVHTKVVPAPKRTHPEKRKPDDENLTPAIPFSDHEQLPSVSSTEKLSFARPGVQHKMLRKLSRGQYNVEALLDLHGKTVEEARDALAGFLISCQQKGLRHLLIIHGKGRDSNRPVLKNRLNHWLRQTGLVLAFCSAIPREGHTGALYVLLRR